MLKRLRWLIAAGLLTMAVASIVFIGLGLTTGVMSYSPVSVKMASVSPGTVIREENSYICGDTEVVYQAPAPVDIVRKGIDGINSMYPEEQGWDIEIKNEKLIVVRKNIDGFCGQHSLYRHLGIHRDRLAIYQGPMGFDHRILRVEDNKLVENLPESLREKLYQAREFKHLSAEEKSKLRAELEYSDETLLNSFLENLDEIN